MFLVGGAYVIFENNTPIYVGAASKHFSHRFQSHAHYDPRNSWGWNALVKKLTNSSGGSPSETEWQKGKNRLLKCEIVRIHIPITNDDSWCYALERELMIGFKYLYPQLLNTNVKKVGAEYLERKLGELVNIRAVYIQSKRKPKEKK